MTPCLGSVHKHVLGAFLALPPFLSLLCVGLRHCHPIGRPQLPSQTPSVTVTPQTSPITESPPSVSLAKSSQLRPGVMCLALYWTPMKVSEHAHGRLAAALPSASPRLMRALDHPHPGPKPGTPPSLICLLPVLHKQFSFKKSSHTCREARHSPWTFIVTLPDVSPVSNLSG